MLANCISMSFPGGSINDTALNVRSALRTKQILPTWVGCKALLSVVIESTQTFLPFVSDFQFGL